MAFPSILSVQWAIRGLIDDLAEAVMAGESGESSSPSPAEGEEEGSASGSASTDCLG